MILVHNPQHFIPSLADMLQPLMQTLKHLVVELVDIIIDDDNIDFLFSIPSKLEDMHTKNIIKTVTIGIVVWLHGGYC